MSARMRGRRFWLSSLLTVVLLPSTVASAQGRVAEINGEKLYYEVAGDGSPLVLIHGWSLNLRMWDPQVSALMTPVDGGVFSSCPRTGLLWALENLA